MKLLDRHLRSIAVYLFESITAAQEEYGRTYAALRKECPELNEDEINAVIRAIGGGEPIPKDGAILRGAAGACAVYLLARNRAKECHASIIGGSADARTVILAHVADTGMWRGLGAMIAALNGSPLAQSFIDEQLGAIMSARGKMRADKRHNAPGGYHDIYNRMWDALESRKDGNRNACADDMVPVLMKMFPDSLGRKTPKTVYKTLRGYIQGPRKPK